METKKKVQPANQYITTPKINYTVRFIDRVFLTIPLWTKNFPVDVRHHLVKLASLQTFKSYFLSVCLDVKVVVYTTRPVGKYGECKYIWSI